MAWAGTKGLPTTGGRSESSLGLQALLCHSTTVFGCSSDEELVRVAKRAGVSLAAWAEIAKWRSRIGSSQAEAAVPAPLQDLLRELHARACVFFTQLGRGTKPGDPLGNIIFCSPCGRRCNTFETTAAAEDGFSRSPSILWSRRCPRRDDLGKSRFVDLSDVSHVDEQCSLSFATQQRSLPVRCRSCWGSWNSCLP